MLFIDRTYFVREKYIPNTTEMGSKTGVELDLFIDEKVRSLLLDALGYAVLKDLLANVTDGELNDNAPQKYKDLVNGKEYTRSGELVKWKGLIFTEGTYKGSLLADYVFCEWLKWQTSIVTGVGEKSVAAKNTVDVSSTQRYTTVWNQFVEQYQGGICPDVALTYIHNGIPFTDYYGQYGAGVSLCGFLSDNASDFPNVPMRGYSLKNQFGL